MIFDAENTGRVLVMNSSRFGQGNPRLGESLMKSFFEILTSAENQPDTILFYNTAVSLACADSPVLDSLASLESQGIQILVNKESLEFYSLDQNLMAGQSSSLQEMTSVMLKASTVVKP